jgi:hypothetical protein
MHASPPPEDRAHRPAARLAVQAVFDRMAGRVEIGGQLLDAHDVPIVGADVVIRSSWGMECSTVSSALGSFGARMSAPTDTSRLEIAIEAAGIEQTVNVR